MQRSSIYMEFLAPMLNKSWTSFRLFANKMKNYSAVTAPSSIFCLITINFKFNIILIN